MEEVITSYRISIETEKQARNIASQVQITYKNLKKPLISTKDCIEAESFHEKCRDMKYGDPETAMKNANHQVY